MKFDRLLVLLGTLWCALWLLVWVAVSIMGLIAANLCEDGTCGATPSSLHTVAWWAIPLFAACTYFGAKSIWPDVKAALKRPPARG